MRFSKSISQFRKERANTIEKDCAIVDYLKKHFTGIHRDNLYYDLSCICNEKSIIVANILRNGKKVALNYDDYYNSKLNMFTNTLALELRYVTNKNIFFDIQKGQVWIYC
jgi:hypothetical protein